MKKIFASLFLIILACSGYRPLARVGNGTISSQQFLESFLDDKSLEQAKTLSPEKRFEHLDRMIEERLILLNARRNKLDSDPEVLRRLKAYEEKLLFQKCIDKEIVEKVIPEKVIREEYRRQSREARLYHIFIPFSDARSKDGGNFLRQIRREILTKGRFEDFAQRISGDSLSSGKGGDLGFVKWGDRDFGESFYEKVFRLKEGEISQPIRSEKGIHLVKVEKFRNVNQPPYFLEKETIKQKLIRRKREKLQERSKAFIEYLRSFYNLSFQEEGFNYLWTRLEEQKSKKFRLKRIFSNEEKSIALLTYSEGQYTIGRFISEFKLTPSSKELLNSKEKLHQYAKNIFPNELLVSWAYQRRYNKSDDIKKALHDKKESLMVEHLENQKRKLYEGYDEAELRDFYNNNKEAYKVPEKFRVQEILVDSYQQAVEILEKNKSIDFDSLARAFNTRKTTLGSNGMLGFISAREYGAVGRTASTLKIGQVSEPIKMGDKYSVIRVLEKKKETIPLFENLKPKLVADLKRLKRQKFRESWMDSLKSNITVAIYPTNMKRVFENL